MAETTIKYRVIFRGILLSILALFLAVVLAVTVLLYSPFMQKKFIDWASGWAYDKWGVLVQVEEIRFRPFNKLYLKEFLVSTKEIDSMTYISEGEVAFDVHPAKLLRKEISLSNLQAETVKVRLLANYTPDISDTTAKEGFYFDFLPAHVDVKQVDFAFRDTVTQVQVMVMSDHLRGDVQSSNLKDQFYLKNVTIDRPEVTVYGGSRLADDNPYLQEFLRTFRHDHGLDPPDPAADTLFWKLELDVDDFAVNDGKVRIYSFDTQTDSYQQGLIINDITGTFGRGRSGPNHVEAQEFAVDLNFGDAMRSAHLTFDDINFTDHILDVRDLELKYFRSEVKGDFALHYDQVSDLRSILDEVHSEVELRQSKLYMADLLEIVPGLSEIEFFRDNRKDTYQVDLTGSGTLSQFRLSRFLIESSGAKVQGRGHWKDMFDAELRSFGADIQQAQIPIRFIKNKFPKIDFPDGVDSLRYVNLKGNAKMDRGAWSVYSAGQTSLGGLELTAAIDTRQETYNGQLSLQSFEIGKFTKSPMLGPLSMRIELEEGSQFNIRELSGHLNVTVDSFMMNGYDYGDLRLYGFFGNNSFLGHVALDKEEVAFDLDTKIDFNNLSDVMAYGRIHRADLRGMNWVSQDVKIRGDIDVDMKVSPIDSVNGYARFNDVIVTRGDTVDYKLNVTTMDMRSWGDNFKDWKLKSDILTLVIDGQFNIANILGTTYEIVKSRHPNFVGYLQDLNLSTDTVYNNDFTMIVNVNDTEEFAQLINPELDTIRNLNLSLTYRNRGRETFEYYFQSSAPKIQYRDISVHSLNVNASGSNTDNEWIIYLDDITAGNAYVEGLQINTRLVGNQLDFGIQSQTINNILNEFYVAGSNTFFSEEGMQIKLDSSSFVMLEQMWNLNEDNYINVGKEKLFFNNFVYTSGERSIYAQSATDCSMVAGIENINIRFLDEIFPEGKFTFQGQSNIVMSVENIFDLTGLEMEATIDDLKINNESFGQFTTLFYTLGTEQLASVRIDVQKDGKKSLDIQGEYDLFNQDQNPVPVFNFDINASQFPILVLEFFLPDIIEKTQGYASADVKLKSDGTQPDIGGRVLINGKTSIPILGTTYDFINSAVNIDNRLIDFAEINMMDKEGNIARATGGIQHDHLSNFRMNTQVTTDKFLLLNTQKTDGYPFYGRGLGSATIDITGPFNQLDMMVHAETGPTSHVSIPISSTISVDDKEAFFIDFVTDSAFEEVEEGQQSAVQIEGLNLEVNLILTPDCQVSIILDESTGDILRARGYSELQIELTRAGNFFIRGTYEAFSGEYQFAQLNFARKMFKINQGGTITWTGDPMNAKIDVDASYSVRTPPYNFILEYIGQNQRLADLAQNATDVDLFLHLRGDLFSPDITFDMEFPELTGQVKNYVEDRLRVITDDQNEINKQVFGLLVARSFIPSVSSVVNIDGTVVNTVSEVITNQISFFLTQYLQESIDEVPFLSGVELNIGYNVYRNNYAPDAQSVVKTGNEFLVQPEFSFLDNRLHIRTEANLQTGTAVTSNTLITHDFVLEYSITEDRRLVGKLYQRTEPYVFEKTSKLGVGLSFKEEFDSFYEFLRGKRKDIQ